MRKLFGILIFICASCFAFAAEDSTESSGAKIVTYPAPASEKVVSSYTVSVNGKPVDIYRALSPRFEGGEYYIAYFDFEGEVTVKVMSKKPFKNAEVYPSKFAVKKGENRLRFTADKPFQAIIIREERAMPLVIFGNPLEKNAPKQGDPNVVYFGAGAHFPDQIVLKDNATLYIAGGAVVKAPVSAAGKNIKVMGRGILSFDNRERFVSGATNFSGCENLEVRDIIIKDAMTWTLVFRNCKNVNVDNLKICCGRMINDDGIDICNTFNVSIKNTFVRAQDDIIAIKGIHGAGAKYAKARGVKNPLDKANNQPCENIEIENCIFWTDSANIFRIGYECDAPAMRTLKCKNLYIPFYAPYRDPMDYWSHAIIWFQPTHDMPMGDMSFDGINIRSDGGDMPVVIANPRVVKYCDTETAGSVSKCIVKNVTVSGKKGGFRGEIFVRGFDAEHTAKDLTFENFTYFGEKIKSNSPNVKIGDFCENIVVK